jgi:sterol desaturase/sphingolipid hydroxylase (fatty acid hydroxylase superfamily)
MNSLYWPIARPMRPVLWRFHAVHHSVTRLWFVNTGRFHFINTIISVAFGTGVALAAGVPKDILIWVSAITAYVGLLTHCNVEMRFGILNYLFNTPALHRWHHSMVREEGDRNYGENLMLFDLVRHFHQPEPPPARRYRHPRADAARLAAQIARSRSGGGPRIAAADQTGPGDIALQRMFSAARQPSVSAASEALSSSHAV